MKLDEGIQDQKLALDITPLIDIVFLLVLFFAVSTSFISTEDLTELKDNVLSLTDDKEELRAEVSQRASVVARLERNLIDANDQTDRLEWMVKALEKKQVELRENLASNEDARKSLKQQLEEAYSNYESLDLQLTGITSERDSLAEQEKLLNALLLEKSQEVGALRADLDSALVALDEGKTEQQKQLEKERMLQALLAEKAAAYEDAEFKLVKANDDKATLNRTLTDLEAEHQASTESLGAMRTEILRLQADLAKFREVADLDRDQVEQILEAQRNLEAGLDSYLQNNQLGITREKQRLVLQLSDQILFNSGSAEINRGGIEVLRKVGDIIGSRIGNLEVQIGGHTDNVPISSRGGPLGSNWGLSAARAVNVVRFLEEEVDIDSRRLSAVGYGEHRPVASNETADGRSQNRRIEIVLVPR